MGKLNLTAQELQALYPPTSRAFENTVQNTLHSLAKGKEQPVMKKKISAALIVMLALIILTISAAIALTSSNLLTFLFGQEQPPKEVKDILIKPEATITSPDINVTLNEYLYDGEKLYLYWTVTNQSGKQLMVTMDPIIINGRKVNVERDKPFQCEYGEFGQILGGEVEDIALPESISFANIYINPDAYMPGYYTFKSGEKLEITSSLSVWELLSPPELDYDSNHQIKDEYLDMPSIKGMPTFQNGTCGLGWLLYLDHSMDVYNAVKNQRMYEENNWAKMLYTQPVQVTITLGNSSLMKTKPTETIFATDDYLMDIQRMIYMSTGGTLLLRVWPKPQSIKAKAFLEMGNVFVVLDADSKEVISSYTSLTQVSTMQTGVKYTIILKPVSGSMPSALLIVPGLVNPAWNQDPGNIYPNASAPNNNDSYYSFVMEDAVRVELMEQP